MRQNIRRMLPEDEAIRSILEPIIGPWYTSLENPLKTQELVLNDLLKKYSVTEYGANHHALEISRIKDYQNNFPILDYKTLQPYLSQVQSGKYHSILSEPPIEWVMTRGSTGRSSKVLPATRTHLQQVFTCGARALIHFALRKKNFDVFTGHILNLNFPSSVHTMTTDGKEMTYGYSSGTYARLNPMFDRVSLIPRQEDIDTLGTGIGRNDWEKRFELAYQQAKDKPVTATMGVTPVILAFARYVKREHGKKPSDIWKPQAMFCTSVKKIHFKYAPILRKLYGDAPVVEMYTATEGVFAQQFDDLPYVTPNYDAYFFEVLTGRGPRMLYELKRGEWGRLIVSGCMFPRYDMGDMIEAAGNNHFRIFGRRNTMTLLEHGLYRLVTRWIV